MNGAHLHLTVNDVPMLAAFTAGALMTIALLVRSRDAWLRAGLLALAVAVGGAAAAFLSGITAVDVIAAMPRTSNRALSQHHVRAIVASSLVALAGIFGLIGLLRVQGGYKLTGSWSFGSGLLHSTHPQPRDHRRDRRGAHLRDPRRARQPQAR